MKKSSIIIWACVTLLTVVLTGCGKAPGAEAYTMGNTYYYGEGVERDYGKAVEYYEQAAAEGNADAMNQLGHMYNNMEGVSRDYDKAKEWYDKAVEAGTSLDWYEK